MVVDKVSSSQSSQPKPFDIVVMGSCNIDLCAYVPRQPTLSETLHGHRFVQAYGGKGANQCVMAAKLGAKAAMLGMVGNDVHGQQFRSQLETECIVTTGLLVSKTASTGVALITVDDNGDNQIVICCGANMEFTSSHVLAAQSTISQTKALICQLEVPQKSTLVAMQLAQSLGVITFFNPSPAPDTLPITFFQCTSVLVVNEGEAGMLSGMKVTNQKDAEQAALLLLRKGCQHVVVTLGGEGVVYGTIDHTNGQFVTHFIESVKVDKVVDTSGAGDAFLGALAYFYVMERSYNQPISMVEAIRRANRVAAITVQKCGTQLSYPMRSELAADLFQ